MVEGQDAELAYKQTHDYMVEPQGPSLVRGRYRVRIFEKPRAIPVVVAERVDDDRTRGVSEVTQYLAAEVLIRYFTQRLWEDLPMRWLETEVKLRRRKGQDVEVREYWEVFFKSFIPRRIRLFGDECYQIDEAGRRPLALAELESDPGLNLDRSP